MTLHRRHVLLALGAAALLTSGCGGGANASVGEAKTLRISGSTTVNPVAADAATVLRAGDLSITVDTQGGSGGGITQLGQGQIDIAMSSKPLSDADKAMYPDVDFVTTQIGQDAVGIIVRKDVVDGGLTSVTKDQLKRLFEGKVKNWKELGGPDLATFVYDKEPGRGTREVLDNYLYGKGVTAPPPAGGAARYAIVGGNEETRTKLLSTPGSVAPLSSAFAEGSPQLAVLAVDRVLPTPENIVAKTYPMFRPLYLLTDGAPAGAAKTFIDYVLSSEGQKLLTKHGYLTVAQLSG